MNVQSQGGYARAQVTDPDGAPLAGYAFAACEPFSGDDTAWQPARLYAIRGDFVPVYGRRYREFSVQGIVPEERIGF